MSVESVNQVTGTVSVPDEEFLKRALRAANLNVLRMVLYYQTGDESLAAMKVETRPVQGGAMVGHVIARDDREEIVSKALDLLTSGVAFKGDPSKQEVIAMMPLFTGETPSDADAEFGYEDMGFEDFSREVRWNKTPDADALEKFSITIIGAGFSGIAAAIQLQRLGINYRIIERMDGIGGTWHLNDYPEARVDISSFLYQFKFEQNYPWKNYYAPRDELKEYVDHVVDKYDIRRHIQLDTALVDAQWNESSKKWNLIVKEGQGEPQEIESNVVISGSGLFSTPNLPDIEGIESFEGKMFHTTDWDHDYDHAGKRVALIGTGSTGSQLAPKIAEDAVQMAVYQRTPNWVTPVVAYQATVSDEKRWLFDNVPGYWNWFVYSNYIGSLQMQELQTLDPDWIAAGKGRVNEKNSLLEKALTDFIRMKVGDREDLYDQLVPTHPPLARRLVIDNAWYDALTRDNVELLSGGIKEITPDGIISEDGTLRTFDLIILGAGFKVSKYLWPVEYKGRNNTSLETLWGKDGARAYATMTMPEFPNFFMLYGPNSGVRGGSFHSWIEVFVRYITQLLVKMIEEGAETIEVKTSAFERYNEQLDKEMKTVLWESEGIGGYFVNEHGRVGTQMPWKAGSFYEFVKKADPENYDFTYAPRD